MIFKIDNGFVGDDRFACFVEVKSRDELAYFNIVLATVKGEIKKRCFSELTVEPDDELIERKIGILFDEYKSLLSAEFNRDGIVDLDYVANTNVNGSLMALEPTPYGSH